MYIASVFLSMICARFLYYTDANLYIIVDEITGVSGLTNQSEGEIADANLWLCFSKFC